MTYTWLSARYANADNSAVIAKTVEAGDVVLSLEDRPKEWAALFRSGIVPTPYAPVLDISAYRYAIKAHIDTAAQARSYDSGVTCTSYVGSTNAQWSAEARAFAAWRDAVWTHAFAELAKVQAGGRDKPSVAEIVAELPSIQWPEALQ